MGRLVARHTTGKIRKIERKLGGLPPVERKDHSTRQAIRMLAGEIRKLQKRGYTLDQIAGELRGEGLGIATPTLAAYLRQDQRKPAATRKAAKARKAEPASVAARGTFTPPDDPGEI